MRQEKRHKLQLFYEILVAIYDSIINHKIAKHTHIQHNSRLSYDKMMNHVNQLEQKGMIHTRRENNSRSIMITGKGKMFLKRYKELINLIESVGLLGKPY
jgi:predicted transcriptional regulator